jgi:hypothetical protein
MSARQGHPGLIGETEQQGQTKIQKVYASIKTTDADATAQRGNYLNREDDNGGF